MSDDGRLGVPKKRGEWSKKTISPGSRFGRWIVLHEVKEYPRPHVRYLCECDCGNQKIVGGTFLRQGKSNSCQSCSNKKTSTTHNESRPQTPEYRSWQAMIRRCYGSPKVVGEMYQARGITVCDEWREGYEAFLDHVGRRPSSVHTLDRIDNNKGYEPGNVRWATAKEQARNKTTNRMITVDGVTRCVAEWIEVTGISETAIRSRLKRGWLPEKAITTPVKERL